MVRIPLVNAADEIIGYTTRVEMQASDLHRISGVWIVSPEGKILMAKRASVKRHSPNKWALAAAGTVEEGETYESNAQKELEEELGIRNIALRPGPKILSQSTEPRWCQFFIGTIPEQTKLTLEPSEVAEARWFTADELQKFFEQAPEEFTKNAHHWLPLLLQEQP